ncbi:protein required for normal CLN1 and CLN2 G1 cyclin expression [Dispira simplex]|nr:protein required for normal CLN1 and CLN2 G1 cyclin expression [Dispira simplex]
MANAPIEIPLRETDNILVIDPNQLPVPVEELCEILVQEETPLHYYLQLAVVYYQQNHANEAIQMLKEGLSRARAIDPVHKVPLINCLASIYLQKARRSRLNSLGDGSTGPILEEASGEQEQYFELATALYNEADRIDPRQMLTWLGKGLLYWLRRKPEQALEQFTNVLDVQPHNLAAKFGLARIYFHMKKYHDALTLYQDLLQRRPSGVPDPRLGIGLCYHKLGMVKEAKHAFERVMELNPKDTSSRVLLAILYFNEFKSQLQTSGKPNPPLLEVGLEYLRAAYQTNRQHPVVADLMADYFFVRHDFSKSLAFATSAAMKADTLAIEAESHYQAARSYHAIEDFDKAYLHYQRAAQLNRTHHLAHFGLGQLLLHRNKLTEALDVFKKLAITHPHFVEVWNMIGSIHARLPNHQVQALQAFDRVFNAIGENTTDGALLMNPGFYVDIGKTYEGSNLTQALAAYQKAVELYKTPTTNGNSTTRSPASSTPLALLNNVSALLHMQGKLDEASPLYEEVRERCGKEKDVDPGIWTTATFNLARLREDQNRLAQAQELYREIISRHPAYADAYLRMGAIQQQQGHDEEAEHWYLDAKDANPSALRPNLMVGALQLAIKQFQPSRRTLERVLREQDRAELYALTCVGNIHLKTARNEPQREHREKLYRRAVEFFDSALARDPSNLYAAHGVGIALAERGHYAEARTVFNQVREACADTLPIVTLSLAHVYVELEQYRNAIMQYEKCVRKVSGQIHCGETYQQEYEKDVLLSLSRAHYILGKVDKNDTTILQALKSAQRALYLFPGDLIILYDLALIEQTFAQLVSEKTADLRSVTQVKAALERLDHSNQLFEFLVKHPGSSGTRTTASKGLGTNLSYDRKLTEQRAKFGESLSSKLKKQLAEQEQLEEQRLSNLEATRRKREEEQRRREEEELRRHQQEEEETRAIEAERRRIQERIRQENEVLSRSLQMVSEDELGEGKRASERSKKSRRVKVRTPEIDDQGQLGSLDQDGSGRRDSTPKRKRTTRPRLQRRGGESRVSSDGNALLDTEHAAILGGEDDLLGSPQHKKYKSKSTIQSSDEEY